MYEVYESVKQKNIKTLIILLFVVIALPILLLAASTIQDIRNRAAGTNEVAIKFSPSSGSFSATGPLSVKVVMSNLAGRAIKVSGAQAVVNVSDLFTINSATCLAPFNGLPFVRVEGTVVTVMCSIATGSTPVSVTGTDLPFASLNLTGAAEGTAALSFTSTRATEAGIVGQAPDVSTAGVAASYTLTTGQGGGSTVPTQATTGDVNLTFVPSSATLPPTTTVKIMASSGTKNIAFTNTVIQFDNSKINLASEITTNPAFSTIVDKTAKAIANSQGIAKIVIAASPTDTKPSGSFEIASFQIAPIITTADSTTIEFVLSQMQYVDSAQTSLNIGTSTLTVNINEQIMSPVPTGGETEVPIGSKDQLTINITGGGSGGTNGPQITFSALLNHTQNNPDLYFRMRVKDELYFQQNPNANLTASCTTPSDAEKDFYIPMRATNGVYKPVSSISGSAQGNVANVTADGWVTLAGVVPDRFYTLLLKAPKFRASKVIEHQKLIMGQSNQTFDFTSLALEPGDLPDPNNSNQQDCTVNSIDISQIVSRIGSTLAGDLDVADVNFDGIVNGNDVSKVVNTLSTKPDDDF